jgi:hypothetical protein
LKRLSAERLEQRYGATAQLNCLAQLHSALRKN